MKGRSMGLTTIEPPTATTETALRYVGTLKSGPGFQTRGPLSRPRPRMWLAAPHPVFNLRLDEMSTRTPIEHARMTGWRYLVVSRSEALATVELAASSRNGAATFCRITDSRMAASVAHAIRLAERSAIVRRRHYMLGMVRVPSIHVHALWFRDAQADGAHDLFAILEPAPAGFPSDRLLERGDFLGLLQNARSWGGRQQSTMF